MVSILVIIFKMNMYVGIVMILNKIIFDCIIVLLLFNIVREYKSIRERI